MGKLIALLLFLFSSTFAFARQYFQQEVSYEIHVSLNDKTHELTANETIKYVNHSPDTLYELYFHLWPNAYKNDRTILAQQFFKQGRSDLIKQRDEDLGYIDQLDFKVNDETVQWELLQDTIDICKIHLKDGLAPNTSITITTPFKVKIPSADISRLGHLGQSYLISQWFPKPAVYDQNGWNYFPYLDQGEYYSEFGTFDVHITLPKNYVLGVTGDLVNGDEELEWLDNKAKETKTMFDSLSNNLPFDMSFPKSDTAKKTLHYHAEQVHDFAWFADKRWHVLKGETGLPESQRKVTTWAMFTNAEAEYWKRATEYINDALLYYSKWVGEYPYNNVTAVDVTDATGSGMEYPMITTIGSYGSAFDLEVTIAHEVGHNWFYGILGSNELMHPWMDEGMNQAGETRYVYTKYANDSAKQMEQTSKLGSLGKTFGLDRFNHRTLQYLAYQYGARNNTDQQPDMNSWNFSRFNYSADAYRKTALSFDFLKSYLGDSVYDACMHEYFNQWKFKHPVPEDVREVFEKSSGKKLNWLFFNLLESTDKIDYRISSVNRGNNLVVTIKNKGSITSPFSISAIKNGKVEETKWSEGFKGSQSFQFDSGDYDEIKIDTEEKMPDIDRRDNTIRTSGILKKVEPLKIQWPLNLEDPDHTQVFATPVAGWNDYNKWMLGAAVYNLSIPEKKFEYLLMPMYSPASKQTVGGGRLSYNFYVNNSLLNKITLSSGYSGYSFQYATSPVYDVSYYLNYHKLATSAVFSFLNRNGNIDQYNTITLRNAWIQYDQEAPCNGCGFTLKPYSSTYAFLDYKMGNPVYFNPYHFSFSVGITPGALLASFEYKQTLSYKDKGKGFEYRIYSGFNGKTSNNASLTSASFNTNLHMSGQTGYDDYLFDEVFLGRTESSRILSQQFTATQGGFNVHAPYATSEVWLAALNLKTALPGILPLYLFADFGTYDIPESTPDFLKKYFMYDYGIELRIIPEVFSVYFPLGYSEDIKESYDQNEETFGKYTQKIRFELNLSKLNPFTLRNQIRF